MSKVYCNKCYWFNNYGWCKSPKKNPPYDTCEQHYDHGLSHCYEHNTNNDCDGFQAASLWRRFCNSIPID